MAETVLGFDFGSRRIGVAVGETLTGAARALRAVSVAPGGAVPWGEIEAVVADWRPARLVVGLPCRLDGTEGPLARAARAFAAELERRASVPTTLWNEALSTEAAREAVARGRRAGRGRGGRDRLNAEAARELLSGWLGENQNA